MTTVLDMALFVKLQRTLFLQTSTFSSEINVKLIAMLVSRPTSLHQHTATDIQSACTVVYMPVFSSTTLKHFRFSVQIDQ